MDYDDESPRSSPDIDGEDVVMTDFATTSDAEQNNTNGFHSTIQQDSSENRENFADHPSENGGTSTQENHNDVRENGFAYHENQQNGIDSNENINGGIQTDDEVDDSSDIEIEMTPLIRRFSDDDYDEYESDEADNKEGDTKIEENGHIEVTNGEDKGSCFLS